MQATLLYFHCRIIFISFLNLGYVAQFCLGQLALDEILNVRPVTLPELGNLQAKSAFLNKPPPVGLRPLQRRQLRHHEEVAGGRLPMRASRGDNAFEDENLAVTWLHGLREAGQDLSAYVVRPVVEDGVHEVGAGALDGLLCEKVVGHELYRGVEVLDVVDDDGEVLEDQLL